MVAMDDLDKLIRELGYVKCPECGKTVWSELEKIIITQF